MFWRRRFFGGREASGAMAASEARGGAEWDFWQYSCDSPDVATENVATWLSILKPPAGAHPADRVEEAAHLLARATAASNLYVTEVIENGGLDVLLRLLSSPHDSIVDSAAAALANCSGPMAAGPSVKVFRFGSREVKLREIGFGEAGLGWKVWGTAVLLSRHVAGREELVRGKSVLELGSGCGLCGLLTAKLGAAEVTVTDCVPALLENLKANAMHLPAQPCSEAGEEGKGDWDFKYRGGSNGESSLVRVRYLEWDEDGRVGDHAGMPLTEGEGDAERGRVEALPRVDPGSTFEVIVASDVIYQAADVGPLVGVIRRRLRRPNGTCVIAHTVRSMAVLQSWLEAFGAAQMAVKVVPAMAEGLPGEHRDAATESEGGADSWTAEWPSRRSQSSTTHGPEHYEGGFVFLFVEHL